MHLELNSNTLIGIWIKFQFKEIKIKLLNTNGIQTSEEGIENVFVNNMVLGKKYLNVDPEKHLSMPLYLGIS